MWFRARPIRLSYQFALALLVSAISFLLQAQPADGSVYRIAYNLSMSQPSTHLFEVRVMVDTPETTEFVDFQMPRWSPGRYAIFDFAKNVQEVRAVLGDGGARADSPSSKPLVSLTVTRLDTQTWRVHTQKQQKFTLSYKVFADDLSGTFSQLDSRHASFNGGSVFMYVVGHKQDPVSLRIEKPADWRVVNGATTQINQTEFAFDNYDLLIDTPTEVSPDWKINEFKIGEKKFNVVVHSFGDDGGRRGDLARDIQKIVRAQIEIMGTPEFESYTFLFHFDPTTTRGDGMEHLNSTQIIETGELANREVYDSAVATASHEFFHVWNVKRLRPVGLGPWDFTRPVVTRGLWIAEGFTNYYGNLALRRSGLISDRALFDSFADSVNNIEGSSGSRYMSAEESSLLAPFLDRAPLAQRTNLSNTAVNYYQKGETLALVLDLLIRGRTEGRRSLDDVMRRAYEEFYLKSEKDSYYLKGRAYTLEEFERLASETSGVDLSDFFARFVKTPVQPPYDEALAHVGLTLVPTPVVAFNPGITLASNQTTVASVRVGGAADAAGLKPGDTLIAVRGTKVDGTNALELLSGTKPGERLSVNYRRARHEHSVTIAVPANALLRYSIDEVKNAPAKTVALREAWLKGK